MIYIYLLIVVNYHSLTFNKLSGNMRRIFLFVLILCAGVVSCNKDQDGAPQNLLIGQWEAVRQDAFRGESWIFGSTYDPTNLCVNSQMQES